LIIKLRTYYKGYHIKSQYLKQKKRAGAKTSKSVFSYPKFISTPPQATGGEVWDTGILDKQNEFNYIPG
jgi:hypothetical protein